MMVLEKRLVFSLGILAVLAAVFAGCGNPWMKAITAPLYKDKDTPEEPAQAGSDKAITAFNITSPASAGVIDEAAKTIAVTVPYGTVVTGLVPTITLSPGASVNPVSGAAQDFTTPVPYTVTAEDGSTENYTVTVTVALNPAKVIETFDITSPASAGVINEATKTIAVTVPYGTDVTSLTPDITITGDSINPASGVAQNFTSSVFYIVAAEDGSTVTYTVTVTAASALNNVTEVTAYLDAASGGTSATDPIPLALDIDLTADWSTLLQAIANANGGAGAYVDLDLSDSTMSGGTEFDPGTANNGEQYITALILPDTAASIAAGGSFPDATFRYFSNLQEVDGEQVTTIGYGAFTNCTSLTSVTLTAATDIGDYTFYGCTSLASVPLPAATDIGYGAFAFCTSLTSVTLTAATDIGSNAFYGCTSLASVTLPAATDIDDYAFYGCTSLASVSLPAATDIGEGAFTRCTSLNNLTFGKDTAPWPVLAGNVFTYTDTGIALTIHVPPGTESNYTGTWGVPASVPVGDTYSSVYGMNHKAITIVDY